MKKYINSVSKQKAQKYIQNCHKVKVQKTVLFFTSILPDYVFLESPKKFWKKSPFEPMRAGFLRKHQNSLRQISPRILGFQA